MFASPTFTGNVVLATGATFLNQDGSSAGGGGTPSGGNEGEMLVADANGDAYWTEVFDCGVLS